MTIRILFPDTDVLILALYLMSTGCTAPIEFELLNSQARRIASYYYHHWQLTLGQRKANTCSICAYWVCFQIGKFNTVSKDRAFKVFMRLASDVNNGLAELGADFTFEMTSDCGKAVSKFIMLLYASMLK